jgi:hypothetical protein
MTKKSHNLSGASLGRADNPPLDLLTKEKLYDQGPLPESQK